MKRTLAIGLALLLSISMLAGCSGGGGSGNSAGSNGGGTQSSEKSAETAKTPVVKGETYSAENISALVPEGWQAFPFYSGGEESPNTFSVHKGALNAMDIWYTPGIQIQFFPEGSGFGPGVIRDIYQDISDLAPQKLGDYTWEGFTGLSKNIKDEYVVPFAMFWTDVGNDKILATVWLELGEKTISLDDADVQAILASIRPNK